MRKVTLAAIQLPNEKQRGGTTPAEGKTDNIRTAFAFMEEAVRAGADLLCLPETFQARGLVDDHETAMQLADEEDGELAHSLSDFTRRHGVYIVAPVLARYGATLRNAAWVITRDGTHLGSYFKVHCTRVERRHGVVPGDTWPVFELDFGRLGVMICHDNSWPESARCLALNGAEVVCWPHVQSGWGDIVWDITLRSRAIDNAVYLLSACNGTLDRVAWRPGMMMGRSGVVGPDGTVLSDAGRHPGVACTAVDLDRVLLRHDFTLGGDRDFRSDMHADRRPETYGPLTRSSAT